MVNVNLLIIFVRGGSVGTRGGSMITARCSIRGTVVAGSKGDEEGSKEKGLKGLID